MPKKKYKIKVDITTALPDLNKLGLSETRKSFWITIKADDPDDACAEAYLKVHRLVTKQRNNDRFKEAAEVVKNKMKIIKIKQV